MTTTEKTKDGPGTKRYRARLRPEEEITLENVESIMESTSGKGGTNEPSEGMDLAEIQNTIRTLLACDTDMDVEAGTRLCQKLLEGLRSVKAPEKDEAEDKSAGPNFIRTSIADYNNTSRSDPAPSSKVVCVRDVVGNLQSDTLSQLPALLADLMASRVDLDALLPATQDEVANLEAMGRSAITLTKRSFLAATLYAELIGMPGAWGAGLIDVGAVSGLAALLRRWNVECMGIGSANSDDGADGLKRKGSNVLSPPATKRSKKKATYTTVLEQLSDDEISEASDSGGEEIAWDDEDIDESSAILSPHDLVVQGLQVCGAIGSALLQKDFMSWSEDLREAAVDAAVSALLTSSAITSTRSRGKSARSVSQDPVVMNQGKEVVSGLSKAIQKCLVVSSSNAEVDDNGVSTSKTVECHETSVFILRGFLPCLSVQSDLPNGQDGRDAAHRVALSTLVGLIDAIASDVTSVDSRSTPTTPKITKTRTSSVSSSEAVTPFTGRKARKKRVSFGGVEDTGSEKHAPPTLKGANTPLRSRSQLASGLTPLQTNGRPRPVLSAVIGMMQKLATSKAVEKASVRDSIVVVLQECLPGLPLLERDCFLRFVLHLCHSKVANHRLTASEILGRILPTEWLWDDHSRGTMSVPTSASKSSRASFSPIVESSSENVAVALFRALQGRLLDKSSVVRARAAICIADTMRKFSSPEIVDSAASVAFAKAFDSVFSELTATLRKRAARDEKATVRKNAVCALAEVLSAGPEGEGSHIDDTDISVFCHVCADPSVSARKAAADALTSLLQRSYDSPDEKPLPCMLLLESAWTRAVLPLVMDAEPTCVDKAVDLFASIVVGPLVEATREKGEVARAQRLKHPYLSSWRILARVHESSHEQGATRGQFGALKVMLQRLEASYEEDIFKRLLSETKFVLSEFFAEENSVVLEKPLPTQALGVWCLLDAATDHVKPLDAVTTWTKRLSSRINFLVVSWETVLKTFLASTEQGNESSSLHLCMDACLRVLSKLAMRFSVEDVENLTSILKSLLGTFTFPSQIAGAAVTALVTFTKRLHFDSSPAAIKRECSDWIDGLSKLCEEEIATFVSRTVNSEAKGVSRALFLAGELCMIGFHADEDSPSRAVILGNGAPGTEDVIAGLYVRPSSRLMRLVQSVLPKHLPTSASSANLGLVATPDAVRAHAFVALGKLCLRDENLAKDCLTILARELHQNMTDKCVSVQSNALLVLGDLCVKYTNLVDRYLPIMAACLQSGSTDVESYDLFDAKCEGTGLVRKHAVLLLSSLLLQDYIKWRGLLFHRFLVASTDNDDGVAHLAEMTLTGPLLSKHPKLFFNNFVESLFVLNRCTAHPIYASAASSGDNGAGVTVGFDGINLSGTAGRDKRHRMYMTMLSRMSDEEKIGITARIAKDVLGAALDSEGDLGRVCRATPGSRPTSTAKSTSDDNAFNVLSDAFSTLTSSALRVGRRIDTDDEVADQSIDAGKAIHVAVAKGKLLSKISRKHLIEIVLPILCKLKSLLHASCSPLLKDLMAFLVEIFRVYKTEVKEFLANDPTLVQEIEYDARQFRKERKFVTSDLESSVEPMLASHVTLE